ncbi:MAG TPA: DUF4974 domain-containing protein [Petrimonas sp.]|nr:DUF4974 domain-containing protein [Petrimonas sp.]
MTARTDILKRFFSGNYSRKDYRLLLKELEKGEDIRQAMEQHWLEWGHDELPEGDVDYLLDRIQHRIKLDENSSRKIKSGWELFRRTAAILIVPLALSFLVYWWLHRDSSTVGNAYAEIQCPLGVRTKFELPDGTTGFLNSGSTLKFPVRFGTERQVKLAGEAYFDVKQRKESPFYVHTENLDIKVLGTTFNVVAYPEEPTEEVTLLRGAVDISQNNGKHLATLTPDRQITFDTNRQRIVNKEVIATQYTSWTEGKLVFRNENMEQVAQRLSRWYNAEIVVAAPQLKKYTFHATFADEQLDEVLKLLALTTPISYTEAERVSSPDGVYRKRQIILKINPEKLKEFK